MQQIKYKREEVRANIYEFTSTTSKDIFVYCTYVKTHTARVFQNGEEDAGRIGLAIILTGMAGSVSFGFILDKTHKFK